MRKDLLDILYGWYPVATDRQTRSGRQALDLGFWSFGIQSRQKAMNGSKGVRREDKEEGREEARKRCAWL